MKKITFLMAFLMAIVTGSYAQSVATYSFAAGTSGVLDPMAGSTQLVASASDDGVSAVTNIGFTFNYAGTPYTQFSVNANGLLRLGAVAGVTGSPSYTNSAANANTNTPVIMPYWDDLATGSVAGGGKVHYVLTGTAPNQKLIIEWFVTVPRGTGSAANAKFQCILEETTGVITFVYGSGMLVNTANSGASIGLATATAVYNTVTVASNTNTTSTFVTANTAAIPAGTTYTWTPPVPCTGTPSAGTVAPANLALCNGSLPGNLVASGFSTGVSGLNFQWEESTDNFVTPVDAVGGSGATTATYTPPAYNGTPKQYRLKITCTNSGLIGYSSVCSIINPANPATQVTALALGTATLTTTPLTWVAGNGGRRVVYFSNSAVFTDPINGNGPALTAAAAYAGSGQQIVYDGTGTGVTVTGLTAGTTYYVKVYEYLRCGTGPYDFYYNVSTGTNILTVATLSPPANDNFANASAIACGNLYTGDTTNAALDEDTAPDGFGADMDARNVWYSFTGTGSAQTVTLNLCGSSYDSSVLVYTGTSGALTLVAGNDDDATCGASPLNTRSRVSFNSDGTTTYYIAIEGFNSGSYGAYTMDVTCAAINPPAVPNQTCATSLVVNVDGTDTLSDNSFGTVNPVQPSCDTFGSIQDVWFSFVAPSSGAVNCLVTNGTMTSSNFAVYSGTCGALVEVGGTCNSNLTAPTTEALTGLTVGNTYYVQVWSNAAEQGTFTLKLTDTALNNESFDTTGFMVYPNPVKDVLNLSYTKDISNVSVHNLLGQTVMSKNINATQSKIDMSSLSAGTYLVKVTVDNLIKTIKIVKE